MHPMTANEFEEWREPQILGYAADMARNAGRPTQEYLALSEREFAELLPHGIETAGHRLLFATDATTDERIGWLWIAERTSDAGASVAWIYDIVVGEGFRRLGYGRSLMEQAEIQAGEMGLRRIELNVFGDNVAARALYESSGYHETARQMAKDL
jgi:ribosomal protein S18 acetylase RimI-like enzyme